MNSSLPPSGPRVRNSLMTTVEEAASAVGIIRMNCVGTARARSEKTSKRATRRKRTGAYFGPLAGGSMDFPFVEKVKGWHHPKGIRKARVREGRGVAFTRFSPSGQPAGI